MPVMVKQLDALPLDAPALGTLPRSAAVGRITSSAIRDLLEVAGGADVISLAGGLPAAEAFPAEALGRALDAVVRTDAGSLQYSATGGQAELRRWAAGVHGADPRQVVVTSGSQQGIELTARATLDPGDVVALADPGYVGAVQAFRLAGARLHGVPCDDGGLDVDALAADLRRGLRPTLVYVVPSFSNPTGGTLTTERAEVLASLADHHGFLIVEDDPYAALRWAGTAPPPLAGLTSRVVTLRTFSKVLAPGLRVAYALAPRPIADALTLLKQAVDLHTATPLQRAVLRLVTRPGFLDEHLAQARSLYELRADALCEALATQLPGRLHATRPEGGMFVWCDLGDVDTEALLPQALRHGVAFVPGPAFAVGAATHRHALRLSFASVRPSELREGVRRLRLALDAGRVGAQRA